MTLDELQKDLDSMLDPLDFPGDWTQRQRNEYEAKRSLLVLDIAALTPDTERQQRAAAAVASLASELEDAERWQTTLVSIRAQVAEELIAGSGYPRTRAEIEHQQNLQLSIVSIDKGLRGLEGATAYSLAGTRLAELLTDAGYAPSSAEHLKMFGGFPWRGSLRDVEKEIIALNKQLDAARREVEEANLTPAEVAQRHKERQMQPVRKVRGDGSQYDRYYDENGRVTADVEVTADAG